MHVYPDRDVASVLAAATSFSGRVWRTDFIRPVDDDHLGGIRFLYEPGSRSFWHIHDREQAIIAVHGHGLLTWEGLDGARSLAAGDWWHVAPGVPHWHGATPEQSFEHLAVNAGGPTHWLHEVSESDYRAAAAFVRASATDVRPPPG